jgi:hypothetical protein
VSKPGGQATDPRPVAVPCQQHLRPPAITPIHDLPRCGEIGAVILRCMYALDGLSGAALVTRADCVKLEMAAGWPMLQEAIRLRRARFQVCSISKRFAAAVMLLVESGDKLANPWRGGSRQRAAVAAGRSPLC